ncbi:unnamed protein product [Linum trigynum]|uniref:Uncharacterized protein n=1 Tax=Linum trigynum TaxID=586398 RepID=A0AAV2DVJ6_9ROSI
MRRIDVVVVAGKPVNLDCSPLPDGFGVGPEDEPVRASGADSGKAQQAFGRVTNRPSPAPIRPVAKPTAENRRYLETKKQKMGHVYGPDNGHSNRTPEDGLLEA